LVPGRCSIGSVIGKQTVKMLGRRHQDNMKHVWPLDHAPDTKPCIA
jgi:hypothetical protein